MSKLIFVIGASGTGKSSYIQNNFKGNDQFFLFDLALKSQELFGDYQAMHDLSHLADIYNTLTEDGLMALFDGVPLVIEYCITGNDTEFMDVLKQARSCGLRTEVIQITLDKDLANERVKNAGNAYFPSVKTNEETMEVLQGVIESYAMNLDFEEICTIGTDDGFLRLFRKGEDGKDTFFFVKDDEVIFDFEPQFEFQKNEDTFYVKTYFDFNEALEDLLDQFEISKLHPLKIKEGFKIEFQKVYHKYLNDIGTGQKVLGAWNKILN